MNTGQPGRIPPLVIVSERGRHSDESRRIVRAQAARASAAQSRVTRARNREEREGTGGEAPQSPEPSELVQPAELAEEQSAHPSANQVAEKPLVHWLTSVLNISASGMVENIQGLASADGPAMIASGSLSAARGLGTAFSSVTGAAVSVAGYSRPQLPRAVPRGFANLQQRIQVPDNMIALVSRTSCFDFGSPGVEERLHQLLFDLIISHAMALFSPITSPGHPIQGHLRIACTCLTIFQGQRANGAAFAHDEKYQTGLSAAWSEVTTLDLNALAEPKSAEASLWAVFIISVTTGSTTDFFHQLLVGLFRDLQLSSWTKVRNILLDFIYPVSFLDELCKSFFESFHQLNIATT